jgi:hypothetical protein
MEEFIGMTSAFIRQVGQDVRVKGYAVIFTDIGPESLERDAPDMFRDLATKSSSGGVQVRGFSRAEEKDGLFRDKQTGEKGVGLWLVDFEEDGQGGHIITGAWSEGPGQERPHEVKYLVVREGARWRAQLYRPAPKGTAASKTLLAGVDFFDGPELLSGQLVFQRQDYQQPNGQWKCVSNVVYSLDLEAKTLVQLADFGPLDARLVKVSDDGRMLCLYDINGGIYVNARFFVHSVESGATKQVKFPEAIESLGIAVLGNTVFVASYGSGPLYQYDFATGSLSEFHPPGLPANDPSGRWLPAFSYPRTRFSEPGIVYFQDGVRSYYRWNQSSGELKALPDFSYCMTEEGKHVWLGERKGNSYPLVITSMSSIPYTVATEFGDKVEQPRVVTKFKFPGGRSCNLDQLSPCDGFALLTVQAGDPGSVTCYIVDLADGHTRKLVHLENPSTVFWVKKYR